jgi:molybdate transport system ATP-binding protein
MNIPFSPPDISEIEIIDDHHVRSLDWGVTFETAEEVSDNITHIGIRAHDFHACNREDINVFNTENSIMVEKPFEWEITLENGLWWKYDKGIYEHEFEIPKYLSVNPKNIILLED